MFFTNSFADNLRELRTSHDLSLTILADILGLKSKVSISRMENKLAFPQYNTLVEISDLFGISIDWLTGRTNNKYSEDILSRIENDLLNLSNHVNLKDSRDLVYYLYVTHIILGKNYFTLCKYEFEPEYRANVIYALNFWKYASKRLHAEGYDAQEQHIGMTLNALKEINDDSSTSIVKQVADIFSTYIPSHRDQIQMLSDHCTSKRAGSVFAKHCEYCISILESAYIRCSTTPILHKIKTPID